MARINNEARVYLALDFIEIQVFLTIKVFMDQLSVILVFFFLILFIAASLIYKIKMKMLDVFFIFITTRDDDTNCYDVSYIIFLIKTILFWYFKNLN